MAFRGARTLALGLRTAIPRVAGAAVRPGMASLARTSVAGQQRFLHTSRPALATLGVHKDTDYNNLDTDWEFTPESYKEIEVVLAKYPPNYKRSAVMPLLFIAQKQTEKMPEHKATGWVPLAAMNKIATVLDMPPMRVYEVASFYTMYNRQPIGKHNIQVCTTSPCMVCDAYGIVDAIKAHLKIEVGETTPDGLFHLMEAECLGCCVNAPMMQIAGPITHDGYYEDLTPESAIQIIEDLRAGKEPKKGSQIGRTTSMGLKKTALVDAPKAPECRADI
uniref:NADH dehydrogenase [ubiquinone] flavoprotein 2, mitochondrial n=1 Tax=Hemiselmis tepida TaxID=464990 RepID=A0A7S0W6B2_9CRYP|mmetsp:Transcript_38168/g.97563  ORF Transcript_38168/g.97563 Transcript_38168/m.97563 type:complete len:277 (+) Transcript_38168:47-877(+)